MKLDKSINHAIGIPTSPSRTPVQRVRVYQVATCHECFCRCWQKDVSCASVDVESSVNDNCLFSGLRMNACRKRIVCCSKVSCVKQVMTMATKFGGKPCPKSTTVPPFVFPGDAHSHDCVCPRPATKNPNAVAMHVNQTTVNSHNPPPVYSSLQMQNLRSSIWRALAS